MSLSTRRSTNLIDQEVQGNLLRKIAMHWVLLLLANTIGLLVWLFLFELPDASWIQIVEVACQRYLPLFIISMVLIPAFLLDTVRLTNRFAGPIRRLRHALSSAARGEKVSPLHFRSNDFWQEIANDFNTLTGPPVSQENPR